MKSILSRPTRLVISNYLSDYPTSAAAVEATLRFRRENAFITLKSGVMPNFDSYDSLSYHVRPSDGGVELDRRRNGEADDQCTFSANWQLTLVRAAACSAGGKKPTGCDYDRAMFAVVARMGTKKELFSVRGFMDRFYRLCRSITETFTGDGDRDRVSVAVDNSFLTTTTTTAATTRSQNTETTSESFTLIPDVPKTTEAEAAAAATTTTTTTTTTMSTKPELLRTTTAAAVITTATTTIRTTATVAVETSTIATTMPSPTITTETGTISTTTTISTLETPKGTYLNPLDYYDFEDAATETYAIPTGNNSYFPASPPTRDDKREVTTVKETHRGFTPLLPVRPLTEKGITITSTSTDPSVDYVGTYAERYMDMMDALSNPAMVRFRLGQIFELSAASTEAHRSHSTSQRRHRAKAERWRVSLEAACHEHHKKGRAFVINYLRDVVYKRDLLGAISGSLDFRSLLMEEEEMRRKRRRRLRTANHRMERSTGVRRRKRRRKRRKRLLDSEQKILRRHQREVLARYISSLVDFLPPLQNQISDEVEGTPLRKYLLELQGYINRKELMQYCYGGASVLLSVEVTLMHRLFYTLKTQ